VNFNRTHKLFRSNLTERFIQFDEDVQSEFRVTRERALKYSVMARLFTFASGSAQYMP
jgi:hypothetical protein